MSKPLVAIVGRPNVGKSTLIIGLAQRRVSIVEDIPGVTRDRIYCDVKWLNREFTLIDTGGIEFRNGKDQISSGIRQQAELAMEEADVILFVLDARAGLTSDDEIIAGILRRTGKPVVVAVNKVDSENQDLRSESSLLRRASGSHHGRLPGADRGGVGRYHSYGHRRTPECREVHPDQFASGL